MPAPSVTFSPLNDPTRVTTLRNGIAALMLRLVVGYGFLWHGYAKLGRGPELFAETLHTLGVPLPLVFAWLTTSVELVGGLAIVAGAFTLKQTDFGIVPMSLLGGAIEVQDAVDIRFRLRAVRGAH